jgi:hypothetical protein
MAPTKRWQSRFRSSLPTLVMSPAKGAGIAVGGDAVNWLWLNIPLMAAFFMAMTGIPLWLVFKHPDQERKSAPRPRATASRPGVSDVTPGGNTRFARPGWAHGITAR